MKNILLLIAVLFSYSALAETSEEAVRRIENKRNATCEFTSQSSFKKCFGSPMTCYYTKQFACESTDGNFTLKLRMKEFLDFNSNSYQESVRKVIVVK